VPLFDSIGDFVRRLGAPRVLGILVVLGVALGGIWGLVAWDNAPEMVPIVRDATLESVAASQRALEAAGIPLAGMALILGIDRLPDMFRSATNITGHVAGAVVVENLVGDGTNPPAEALKALENGDTTT